MKNLLKFIVLSITFLSFDNLAFGAVGDDCSTKQCDYGQYCAEQFDETYKCASCKSPYINSTAGATAETQCYLTTDAGYYVAIAGEGQTTCLAGNYCPGNISVYYGATGGSKTCEAGYYCPAGASDRKQCPAGTYNNLTGKSSVTECLDCPTGSHCQNAGTTTPTQCPASKYNDLTKQLYCKSCTNAPTGATYGYSIGKTDNTCPWGITCEPGQFWRMKKDGMATTPKCEDCTKGSYCEGTGVSNTTIGNQGRKGCPAGKTTPDKGATSLSDCTFVAGPNGTKFCDTNGCFYMPSGTVFN